jgi:hypothetical protein
MSSDTVRDDEGRDLVVGARVRLYGADSPDDYGVVVGVSDPDGDVRDGVPVAISPYVRVRFDNGVEDSFLACSTARWYDEPPDYRCEDVEVVIEQDSSLTAGCADCRPGEIHTTSSDHPFRRKTS